MIITLVIATVDIEPGWAVGTAVAHGDETIDPDILLDASGQPWIPDSALAGSLRAHLASADHEAEVRLMGSRPPRNQAEAARITASPLRVVGAAFALAALDGADRDADVLETTGQTAIDRRRGAALAGSPRISRLAAAGGRLSVHLRHDAQDQPPLSHNLELIAAWHPAIGRDRTRNGRARLQPAGCACESTSSRRPSHGCATRSGTSCATLTTA